MNQGPGTPSRLQPRGEADDGGTIRAMVESVERAVRVRTGQCVRDLRVAVDRREITLTGRCDSFHVKQLAQHAAMRVARGERLNNRIEVE